MQTMTPSFLRILFFLCFVSQSTFLFSQKYSNEFLNIGIGARAQAMGNAVVANVQDVSAGYWNPAGLVNIGLVDEIQIGAMHAEWFAGIGKYDYLSVAMPFDDNQRVLGVSLIRFGIDDIPNTLSLYESDGTVNYDNIVPFSAADYAALFSYAQKMNIGNGSFRFGGNAKLIFRQIGQFASAFGFGIDAGIQYEIGKWQLGVVAKDVTNTFNAWRFGLTDAERDILQLTNNELPINSVELTRPQLILGFSREFAIKENYGLLANLDFQITTDGQRNTLVSADPFSIGPRIGLEGHYKKLIFVRLGANNFQQDTDLGIDPFWTVEPSLGLGIRIKKIQIDYAYTDVAEQRNNTFSHVISLQLNLKRKAK